MNIVPLWTGQQLPLFLNNIIQYVTEWRLKLSMSYYRRAQTMRPIHLVLMLWLQPQPFGFWNKKPGYVPIPWYRYRWQCQCQCRCYDAGGCHGPKTRSILLAAAERAATMEESDDRRMTCDYNNNWTNSNNNNNTSIVGPSLAAASSSLTRINNNTTSAGPPLSLSARHVIWRHGIIWIIQAITIIIIPWPTQ